MSSSFRVSATIGLLRVWLYVYEALTWPFYALLQRPHSEYMPLPASSSSSASTSECDGLEADQLRQREQPLSSQVYSAPTRVGDPSSVWRNIHAMRRLETTFVRGCHTMDALLYRAVRLWPDRPALGTRRILEKFEEKDEKSGKSFVKLRLGEYVWETFAQVGLRVGNFGAGLVELGHFHDDSPSSSASQTPPQPPPIIIFAETRAEWMICAQAAFRHGIPLVTLYATLGDAAILRALEETEATTLVTSEELCLKVANLLCSAGATHRVRRVIFMNHQVFQSERRRDTNDNDAGAAGESSSCYYKSDQHYRDLIGQTTGQQEHQPIRYLSMHEVELIGERRSAESRDVADITTAPGPDSLAVIMYTSGSTGNPKGVEILHRNLIAGMTGGLHTIAPISPVISAAAAAATSGANQDDVTDSGGGSDEVYIAYLPLAHVLELICESAMFSMCGIRVGYSSPHTLSINSTKIARGQRPDLLVLRPTLMACVPTILDRIRKAVLEKAIANGPIFNAMFKFAFEYRKSRLLQGFPSLLLDAIVFRRIRRLLGGNLRLILSGGAPLGPEVQDFINICFCPIVQGYGLTESCGSTTTMRVGDVRTDQVGPVMRTAQLRLVEWAEGGCSPLDKPRPRGEIVIGGGSVARGYFKQPEKTSEAFFDNYDVIDDDDDDDGGTSRTTRWFRTGDIGELFEDGTLRIIDRKKDLVKLQHGEYVALGVVEKAALSSPFVESVCVIALPTQSHTGCIVSPKRSYLLQQLALKHIQLAGPISAAAAHTTSAAAANTEETENALLHERMCADEGVAKLVLADVRRVCAEARLQRVDMPEWILLDNKSWTPDTGLVTDSYKLKRPQIAAHFAAQIADKFAATTA